MGKRRIEILWNVFKILIPKDAPEHQLRDMKIAFFAGASGILDMIMMSLTPGADPQPEDEKMMSDIMEELQEFNLKLKNGEEVL